MLTTSDEHGVHGRPNAQFEKWKLNAYGFRGKDMAREKRAGVVRVIIVGASETFGLYESPDMGYPAQVQHMLDRAAPGRFEVINAGIAGMSPPRLVNYFDSWLKQFEPDILVFYPTPHYYLDENAPAFVQRKEFIPPPRWSLRLTLKTRNLLKSFLPEWFQTMLRQRKIDRIVRMHPPAWVWPDVPSYRVNLFAEHLTVIVRHINESGVRLVLCTHANCFTNVLTPTEKYKLMQQRALYPRASEKALLSIDPQLNKVVHYVAAQHGLTLADVDSRVPKVPSNFADYCHLTDNGARAVASVVYGAIMAESQRLPSK